MFIAGLRMLRGPRTAVRGNQIAAVGMAIAIIATLLQPGVGDWLLIVVGVAIGVAVGVPSARSVKMTAMPQMVALFNGVGGGAVALISVVEFRDAGGDLPAGDADPDPVRGDHRLDLLLGLEHRLPQAAGADEGRRSRRPRRSTPAAAGDPVALAVVIAAGSESELLFWLILLFAGALGVLRGGADRRRRHAGRDLAP